MNFNNVCSGDYVVGDWREMNYHLRSLVWGTNKTRMAIRMVMGHNKDRTTLHPALILILLANEVRNTKGFTECTLKDAIFFYFPWMYWWIWHLSLALTFIQRYSFQYFKHEDHEHEALKNGTKQATLRHVKQ